MSLIRDILGKIILFFDRLTTPKSLARAPADQAEIDGRTSKLVLYHFMACPFCVKVRRGIKRLGLNIEMKDVRRNEFHKEELLKGGGDYQVPCLRILKDDGQVQWMYESSEILKYLNEQFGA